MSAPAPRKLTAAERERLDAMVAATQVRQAEQLERAIDAGLRHLPLLLRGPVKALLFR